MLVSCGTEIHILAVAFKPLGSCLAFLSLLIGEQKEGGRKKGKERDRGRESERESGPLLCLSLLILSLKITFNTFNRATRIENEYPYLKVISTVSK